VVVVKPNHSITPSSIAQVRANALRSLIPPPRLALRQVLPHRHRDRCDRRSRGQAAPLPVNDHASSSVTMTTTAAMYPNNTFGERLRLYIEENFHDA
jgi:hypothetical protein